LGTRQHLGHCCPCKPKCKSISEPVFTTGFGLPISPAVVNERFIVNAFIDDSAAIEPHNQPHHSNPSFAWRFRKMCRNIKATIALGLSKLASENPF
jgi:hypothetical protein